MWDISQGVQYMHDNCVSHRDLKVENILLKDQKFKLADFGSCETSDNFIRWANQQPKKFVDSQYDEFEKNTTLMYRPPEMMNKYLKYDVDFQVDMWQLGCILFTLCFGYQPF